jgi:hypothetical protein
MPCRDRSLAHKVANRAIPQNPSSRRKRRGRDASAIRLEREIVNIDKVLACQSCDRSQVRSGSYGCGRTSDAEQCVDTTISVRRLGSYSSWPVCGTRTKSGAVARGDFVSALNDHYERAADCASITRESADSVSVMPFPATVFDRGEHGIMPLSTMRKLADAGDGAVVLDLCRRSTMGCALTSEQYARRFKRLVFVIGE